MKNSRALWGVLLIFIGVFLILGTFDWFSVDLFGALRVLWPVFIIAGGLTLFFKQESHLPRVILWLLVFALIGGYAIYLGARDVTGFETSKTFAMERNMKSGSFHLNAAVVDLDLSAGSELAIVNTQIGGIKYEYLGGNSPVIIYSQDDSFLKWQGNQDFEAQLNRDIPWTIEINTGTTKGTLDFSDIQLEQCTVNTGSCELDIIAGSKSKDASIIINGGAVNVDLTLPEDVGVEISSAGALTKINEDVYMLTDDEVYRSDNFDSAPNKLYLEMACGAGNVTVNR